MKTIFILGPTCVGKTEAAEKIALKINGEIINMDMGQLYAPICIGTAKPLDWKKNPIKHHLFDLIHEPKDYSVVAYREKVVEALNNIHAKGATAIFVGGSLFYLQSLLFGLRQEKEHIGNKEGIPKKDYTWERLYEVDPERAKSIHPKDTYRIQRALTIWYKTGQKPSDQKPYWNPIVPSMSLLWLFREKQDLQNRITSRTELMSEQGWLQEVALLPETWKEYVHKKRLCGYNIVVDAYNNNKKKLDDADKKQIVQNTMQYAKRQKAFWLYFKKKYLVNHTKQVLITEINLTFHSFDLYLEQIVLSKGL
ncbi:tRNA (adenosine(37)-N6)-dimethylallyltransferase MiaA [Candidatus Dependentiae bacterium]|nr:MAG: tRNA (adenosine(37)-N6)-dimethylallyltransferase MiaA [Candidatus Dependentiae bacterium]